MHDDLFIVPTFTLVDIYHHPGGFQENILTILSFFFEEFKNKQYLIWKP